MTAPATYKEFTMYTSLISAADLAPHLTDPRYVIFDCRHDLMAPEAGRAAYAAGHLQNAHLLHLDDDLAGPHYDAGGLFRGRHPLPERAALIATLRRCGVNDDSQVVAYDAHGGMFAARLWWLLRWIGHAGVAVLDGGLAAWQARGLPLVTVSVGAGVKPGTLTEQASLSKIVSVGEVAASHSVIDARAPERFRGENETIDPVGGHIPGAKNRFFKDNLQADGRFKSAQELQREWAPFLGAAGAPIMQCGSGVTACHNLLALEVAGLHGAALYPGSWSEWCADPSRPLATGP